MGNRHRPYDPYDPNARSRRRDDGGWVVAGEEPDGWSPPPRNGHPGDRPRHGQPTYGQPGYSQPGHGQPNYSEPGHGQPGYSQPGHGQPGYGWPERAQPPDYGRPAGSPPEQGQRPEPWSERYPPQQPAYPAPRHQYGGQDPQGRRYAAAYPTRQPPRQTARQQPPAQTGEPVDDEPRPPLASTMSWTIATYLLPMLLYLAWAFTRSGTAPAGCVDASGAPCPSPRVEAAENLLGVLPSLVGALVLALLIAVGLRRMATGWRAASIGLAAAVIGGGIATVVTAALT